MAYSASTAPGLQEHKTKARTSQNSFKSCSCVGTDKQTGADLPDWGTYVTRSQQHKYIDYTLIFKTYVFICDFFFCLKLHLISVSKKMVYFKVLQSFVVLSQTPGFIETKQL